MSRKRIDWTQPFVRISDSLPGHVVYHDRVARLVVVEFGNGWRCPYDLTGTPLLLFHEDHKLVNII